MANVRSLVTERATPQDTDLAEQTHTNREGKSRIGPDYQHRCNKLRCREALCRSRIQPDRIKCQRAARRNMGLRQLYLSKKLTKRCDTIAVNTCRDIFTN